MSKFSIYQVLPRLFGNPQHRNIPNGTIEENGSGKFNYFTQEVLGEIKSLGISHVWFTGVIEHATKTDYTRYGLRKFHPAIIKGNAGSPYAISDYYDVDPDLAVNVPDRMREFESLIERTHNAGLKVLIDFVPNHLAREYASDQKPAGVRDFGEDDDKTAAFHPMNNFYYLPGQSLNPQFDAGDYTEFPARVTGNDHFSAYPGINDWYETVKLNYGVDYAVGMVGCFDPVPDTWLKMKDILLFWAGKGVAGFRCDMAEMVPVQFWEWAIGQIKKDYPAMIFIAEIYNPHAYRDYIFRGGFDYLYDKVGLYDLLRNIVCNNHSASAITQAWQNLQGIEDRMLNFLENHDEQRIASDFFAGNPNAAKPAMMISALLTKAPVMIYAGQELGERGMDQEGFSGRDGRTTIFDYWCVDSLYRWANGGKFNLTALTSEEIELRNFYQKILTLAITQKALCMGEMYDLQYANHTNPHYNPHKIFSFFRNYEDEYLLIIVSFENEETNIKINIPIEARSFVGLKNTGCFQLNDLMDNDYRTSMSADPAKPFEVQLPARGGRVLQLIMKNEK